MNNLANFLQEQNDDYIAKKSLQSDQRILEEKCYNEREDEPKHEKDLFINIEQLYKKSYLELSKVFN